MEHVSSNLKLMSCGGSFNEPIVGAVWPVSLLQLLFGGMFNQAIVGVVWPASLRSIRPAHRGSCVAGLSSAAIVRRLVQPAHRGSCVAGLS